MTSRLLPALFVLSLACRTDKPGGMADGHTDTGLTDADGDGHGAEEDCDDSDASVHPGAKEVCDGIDNDCDESIDEEVMSLFYADADADGFGDANRSIQDCEAPSGYVEDYSDCDDGRAENHPGAEELCDTMDNDCDGDVDEEVLGTWYPDADEDGYGDPDHPYEGCEPLSGYVLDGSDCNDTDAGVWPGAEEVCDELDNDCDGDVDEDAEHTFYLDIDGDGYGVGDTTVEACSLPAGFSNISGDCDDTDDEINPGATEYCDEIDNDCDGVIDEDDAADASSWYVDADSDGFGDASSSLESCEVPSGYVDNDTDCDDADATVNPGAEEVCDDLDNDCDGAIDDDDPGVTATTTWYIDYDGDGFGSDAFTAQSCEPPSGYIEDATDCDDADPTLSPDAEEVCDGIDNDCDGEIDEDSPVGIVTWYADVDGDGYGDPSSVIEDCEAPSGYVGDDTDCDDTDDVVNPGALEICDEVDNDCDGSVDADDSDLGIADCFGDGSDGVVAIGDLNINTQASGSRSHPDGVAWRVTSDVSGASLSLESTSGLEAGDFAVLIDMQGDHAGAWDLVHIASVSSSGVTLAAPPGSTYGTASEDIVILQRVPQYESLTVTGSLTASAWDGLSSGASSGRATGIVAVMVQDVLEVQSGAIVDVSELGFAGAETSRGPESSIGEVTLGGSRGTDGGWADGGAGGGTVIGSGAGGRGASSCSSSGGSAGLGGGGGGGKITHCAGGSPVTGGGGGGGGSAHDAGVNESTSDLSVLSLGGGASAGAGGGESGANAGSGTTIAPAGEASDGAPGDAGGGIVLIWAASLEVNGAIDASGGIGGDGSSGGSRDGGGSDDGGGGGGEGGQGASGGTILLSGDSMSLGVSSVLALGGTGGDGGGGGAGFSTSLMAGGLGAIFGGEPTPGTDGIYAGDGGAPGGGGSGGEAGAGGLIRVEAGEVNGSAYGSLDADEAVDDATDGTISAFEERG